MSKHLKIFVSILFIVIIILAICITRFYFDVSKNTVNNTNSYTIDSVNLKNEYGVNNLYVFENEDNLFGVVNENGGIVIEPDWKSIEITEENFFIVSNTFRNSILYGCIDSEGNTKIPFIYSKIEKFGSGENVFYIGTVAEDNSCIVYDSMFNICFQRVWEKYDITDNKLRLYYNDNVYCYFVGSDGISLKNAIIESSVADVDYSISFNSRVLLSKLDYEALEKISECISAYLDYSFTGDYKFTDEYISAENRQNFRTFFSEYPNVFSKTLKEVRDVSVYQGKKDDGSQCIIASVTVNADVSYMENEEGKKQNGLYHSIIFFDESLFDINMASASFSDDKINSENSDEKSDSYSV